MKYSASCMGFFPDDLSGYVEVPGDLIDIDPDAYEQAKNVLSSGGSVSVVGGALHCTPRPEATDSQRKAAVIRRYEVALDAHLDAVAKKHRYDNRFTFALRAGYPGPYQAEGIAYAQWMDDCNVQSFALLGKVQAGEAEMPTREAFIAALPPFVPPEGK